MNPKPLRHVDIFGKAGRLEALYRELQDPAAVAVVCHPLPTGGGTLHNKVVFRMARGLESANVATLRFNFRGVGASTGTFDGGEGEGEDFLTALAWITKKHPDKPILAGGFSFGAWVASRAACEVESVRALFLVGTPINKYDFGYLRHCEKPMLFVHGTEDEYGDVSKLENLIQHVRNAESVIVTGADHFFVKQVEAVEETVRAWAEELLQS